MAPHVKNERARLARRMEQVLDHLATLDREAVATFRATRAAYEVLSQHANERYLRFRSTLDAIRACLEFEGRRLKKREVATLLMDGGFAMDPVLGPRLVVENINKNIRRGNLDIDDEELVGLPEWGGKQPDRTP